MAKKQTPAKATEEKKATATTETAKAAPKAAKAAKPKQETASKAPATAKTAKPKKEAAPKKRAAKQEPTDAEVSQRAYELFLERGGTHGYHYEDWLRAERELRGAKN